MGTTRSGAYINTKGSGKRASDFAVIHSIEGDFTKQLVKINGKKVTRLRLTNGGHGQRGIELLKKYGIKYNIVKTYPNGVRVGNIPNHKIKKKRRGISQSWFPTNWNRKDVKHAAEHVAGLKKNRHKADGYKMSGMYKGVRVVVVKTKGKIATIFPDSTQPTKRRKK